MKESLNEKAVEYGKFIAETHSTVRKTAEIFGVSKSTIHYYVSKKLKKIDQTLYLIVKEILKNNFEEKHIRGGISTKKLYQNKQKPG